MTNGNSKKADKYRNETLRPCNCHWHFHLFHKLGQVKLKFPVIKFSLYEIQLFKRKISVILKSQIH